MRASVNKYVSVSTADREALHGPHRLVLHFGQDVTTLVMDGAREAG